MLIGRLLKGGLEAGRNGCKNGGGFVKSVLSKTGAGGLE
jgi:hypothetical protein